jgi:hypothetical protein
MKVQLVAPSLFLVIAGSACVLPKGYAGPNPPDSGPLDDAGCYDGLSSCAGSCVDLQRDNQNCGACGVRCGDDAGEPIEACSAGRCCLGNHCPTILASGQSTPGAIAVDTSSVYWVNNGCVNGDGGSCRATLMSVPLGGGGSTTLYSGPGLIGNIVLDSSAIYWPEAWDVETVAHGALMKASLEGGAATRLLSGSIGYVAVESPNLYWTDDSSGLITAPLMQLLDGGSPIILARNGIHWAPMSIAVDASNVYWLAGFGLYSPGTFWLMKVARAGGATTTIVERHDFFGASPSTRQVPIGAKASNRVRS